MNAVPLEVRADLLQHEAYRSPQLPARYRMNTNESPYPPPRDLVEEVLAELKQSSFHRYPDQDARSLRDAIAVHEGWGSDGVWLANGSNEVFLHLFLAFGGPERSSLTFEPTYSLHTLIPQITGTRCTHIPRGDGFEVQPALVQDVLQEQMPDVVVFCSPNNPTGALEDRIAIETALGSGRGLVVVDEAYIEFARPGSSIRDLLDQHPNLIITKTFSKAWSLAGARIGYLLAHPWLVERLAKVRLPYHLSSPSQLLGLAAMRHAEKALELVGAIQAERDRLIDGLESLGVSVHPSEANFVLFEVDDPHAVWTRLLEREVLVRDYSKNDLLRRCLRVTATKPEETDAFLSALEEVL